MFGIQVKLRGSNGDWSSPYTYKHTLPLQAGIKVVVPVREHFSIGEVVASVTDPEFKHGVKYKWVVQVVDFSQYNLVKDK
jgi:primosomal protein N'